MLAACCSASSFALNRASGAKPGERKRKARIFKPGQDRDINIRDLAIANRDEVKRRLLTELKNLSPVQFEHFCSVLLQQLGFQTLTVTRRSGDGGIDGHGDFRQGAVSLRSAFQAKRWTDNAVGRPDIDRFRGAIQGEFDHGVFITTSRFARRLRPPTARVPSRFFYSTGRPSWSTWSNEASG